MTFKSTLPTNAESRRLTPIESSKRIVLAFAEAREELRRRGLKDTLQEAAKLLSPDKNATSSYQLAVNHIRAVEVYGISDRLAKQEAVRRLRMVDPLPKLIAADLDEAQDARSDPEILADALSNLFIRMSDELLRQDAKTLAGFLNRDALKRGSTRSALIDIQRWLDIFEKALERDLPRKEHK